MVTRSKRLDETPFYAECRSFDRCGVNSANRDNVDEPGKLYNALDDQFVNEPG